MTVYSFYVQNQMTDLFKIVTAGVRSKNFFRYINSLPIKLLWNFIWLMFHNCFYGLDDITERDPVIIGKKNKGVPVFDIGLNMTPYSF